MDPIVELPVQVGAVYAAIQGIAQVVMLFAPKNTIAFRWAKYLVSGPARK